MIQVARLLWMSLLVLVPLTTRTPASGLLGTGRLASYLWTDGLLALTVFVLVLNRLTARTGAAVRDHAGRPAQILFVVLFEVQYVSLLAAVVRGDEMTVSFLGAGLVWLKALLVFIVAKDLVRNQHDLRLVWRLFLVTFAVVCVIGLLELMRNEIVTGFLNTYYGTAVHLEAARHLSEIEQYRVTATFDRNPHGLALFMLIGITALTSVLVHVRQMTPGPRLGLYVLLAAGVIVMLVTSSLLALFGTLAAVGTVLVSRLKHRLRGAIAFPVLFVALGLGASRFLQTSILRLTNAIAAIRTGELSSFALSSFTVRFEAWGQALALMRDTPLAVLVGVGPAVLVHAVRDYAIYTDNDYLFVLFTTGIVGLAAFLALLGACAVDIQRRLKACADDGVKALLVGARGTLCGLAFAAVGGPFFTSEAFSRISFMVWTLLGIACAVERLSPLHSASSRRFRSPSSLTGAAVVPVR